MCARYVRRQHLWDPRVMRWPNERGFQYHDSLFSMRSQGFEVNRFDVTIRVYHKIALKKV